MRSPTVIADTQSLRFFTPEGLETFYLLTQTAIKRLGSQKAFAAATGWSESGLVLFLKSVEKGRHHTHELLSPVQVLKAAHVIINPKTNRRYAPYRLLAVVCGFPDGQFSSKLYKRL